MAPVEKSKNRKPGKGPAVGGGTLGNTPPVDTLDPKQLKKMYGLTGAIVNNDKSLQDAIKRITRDKITDPSLIDQIILDTTWFRGYTNTRLQVDKERRSKDPSIWEAQVGERARQVRAEFESAGAEIDEATARMYAENLIYGSARIEGNTVFYNDAWMRRTIAGAIDYSKTKNVNGITIRDLDGQAGAYAEQLTKLAADYGMDISRSGTGFNDWLENSLRRLMESPDPEKYMVDVDDELKQNAISMYPGMASQIERGFTLKQALDPYLKMIATELEFDPNMFDLNDNLLQRAVNGIDDKGNHKPMSLYDAKLAARKDERWQYTSTAKKEYTDMASTILKDFGFLG